MSLLWNGIFYWSWSLMWLNWRSKSFIPYAFKPAVVLDYSIKQNSFFDLRPFSIKILMWTVPNEGVNSKSTLRLPLIIFTVSYHLFPFLFQLRSNIPCHLTDISCGLRCNQMLKCGMHKCKRICHKGECLIDEECKQPCIIPRLYCNHPCMAPCHPSSPCPTTSCCAKVRYPKKIHCKVTGELYGLIISH